MRYVQSLPPIVEPLPDSGAVRPAAQVGAVAPVGLRSLPPLVFRHHQPAQIPAAINRRWVPRMNNGLVDRRVCCRRIHSSRILQELRSGTDRRTHCQRADDVTTAIDEKI